MKFYRSAVVAVSLLSCSLFAANKPFPQSIDYPNCIKPNVSQDDMNRSVASLFDYYKNTYLVRAVNTPGGYYMSAKGNGAGADEAVTHSEAHGYGMMIFALMGGYDQEAQTIFDGLFRVYRDHPSRNNPLNMGWLIGAGETYANETSATDGDMDIAYALLLAHSQWGSKGAINYLAEATKQIEEGILASDMGHSTARILPGDWSDNDYSTRCSDWMPGHLRAYNDVTDDPFWLEAVDTVYSLISSLTAAYSPNTGLMPDFVDGATPYPDQSGGGTGEDYANSYYYNGCRYPWRMTIDYALYGDLRAKTAMDKLITWVRSSTNEDPSEIKNGYYLDGNPIKGTYDVVFAAPMAAATIVDGDNQDYLNKAWNLIKDDFGSNEYELGINLLSMMLISGNWWKPQIYAYTPPSNITLRGGNIYEKKTPGTFIGKLSTYEGAFPYSYTITGGENSVMVRNDSLFTKRAFKYETEKSVDFEITVTDDSSKTFAKSFTMDIFEAGENLLPGIGWSAHIDPYGSSIDTASGFVNRERLAASFSMVDNDQWNNKWVYATLTSGELPKTMKDAASLTITYSSTAPFSLALPMESSWDSAYYRVDLPVSAEPTTLTFAIDDETFKQPETWGAAIAFAPEEVKSVTLNTDFAASAGSITVTELKVDGMTAGGITSVAGVSSVNRNGLTGTVTSKGLQISAPKAGAYSVAIYSPAGRELYRGTHRLAGGTSLVQFNGMKGIRGMVLVSIAGEGFTHTLKGTMR